MGKDVFISHSAKDRDAAYEIAAVLEQQGIPCWIAPRDVTPGRNFGEEILDAIEGTRATVLILSEHSNASVHVRHEIERAVSKGRTVFPVRIRDVPPSRGLELFISSAQWIDAWSPPLEDAAMRLASALKALLRGEAAETIAAPVGVTKPAPRRQATGSGRRFVQIGLVAALAVAALAAGRAFWMRPSDDVAGILLTVSDPVGSDILIDGSLVGQSTAQPKHIALARGEHRLRVQADGYWPYERVVDVRSDTAEPLAVKLSRTNAIAVTVTPNDAKVAIDGKPVERASAIELRDGQHTVDVSAAGYEPYRQVVPLEGGRHESLVVTLNPVKHAESDHPPAHVRAAAPAAPAAAAAPEEARPVRRAQADPPRAAVEPTPAPAGNSFADSFKKSFGENLGRNLANGFGGGAAPRGGFPHP